MTGGPRPPRRLIPPKLLLALLAVRRRAFSRLAGLILLQIIAAIVAAYFVIGALVPVYDLDWRVIHQLLYYQAAELSAYEAVLDPVLFFRLKPHGVVDHGRVRINGLGFRGPERTAEKPHGAFRVICLGGSNTYGLGLADDETWPAQLERELHERFVGDHEVWNGGACAYVGSQIARLGEETLAKYRPDLLVIGLSHPGAPAFLDQAPIEPYFEKFPQLWLRLFYLDAPLLARGLDPADKLRRLQHERVYRFYYAEWMKLKKTPWLTNPGFESENRAAIAALLEHCAARRVGVCFFISPTTDRDWAQNYYAPKRTPAVLLDAAGLPEEYGNVHPPAYVATWYAQELAGFLFDRGLLGSAQRRPPVASPVAVAASADEEKFALAGPVRIEKETTWLPGGAFMMGCSPGDALCQNDERPRHRVMLSAFRIDRTEVTDDQYRRCVTAGACEEPAVRGPRRDQPGLPVVGVRWTQAAAYCRWRGMRLPTEAEWEFAARAGNSAPGGALEDIAWFHDNAERRVHPVARKRPNAWGLYDLLGNVAEWCADGYAPGYYAASPAANPRGEESAGFRVVRGGAWFTDRRYVRASYRHAPKARTFAAIDLGFRCVQDAVSSGGAGGP